MDSSDIEWVQDEVTKLVRKVEHDVDLHVESGAAGHAACYAMVLGALSASGHSLDVAKSGLEELETLT